MKKSIRGIFFLALIMVASLTLLSCDEGNEARDRGQTIIDGKVVVEDSSASRSVGKSSILARLKDFFSLVKSAYAQPVVIQVTAFQDGAEVDSDTADAEGNFQLTIPEGGIVTLRFETGTFTVNEQIGVTPNSEVTLDISLVSSSEFEFNTFEILSPRIRVRELENFDFEEERANFIIDGGGEDCILATGSSEVGIKAADISLTNCEDGIVGEDFSTLTLHATAVPTLSIDADDNGIHARNDSFIRLIGTDIFISAGTNGILATGSSEVDIEPSGNCLIEGGDEAVDERDSADVDLAECQLSVT